MEPHIYSEHVRIGRGLCPLCHGYDEIHKKTVCVCPLSEQIHRLHIERNAINDLLKDSLEKYDKQINELDDEYDRVRKRRGHD